MQFLWQGRFAVLYIFNINLYIIIIIIIIQAKLTWPKVVLLWRDQSKWKCKNLPISYLFWLNVWHFDTAVWSSFGCSASCVMQYCTAWKRLMNNNHLVLVEYLCLNHNLTSHNIYVRVAYFPFSKRSNTAIFRNCNSLFSGILRSVFWGMQCLKVQRSAG